MATTISSSGISPESLDAHGISISVSDRQASAPLHGSFCDSDFATAVPVHFHNLDGTKFIGLFSQRWHAAPRTTTDPNSFSSHTVDSSPSWAAFDGLNGHHYSIAGQYGPNPTTKVSYDSRVLTGACSRNSTYLYLMQRYTSGGATFGVVSHFHINPLTWQMNLLGEEVISDITVGSQKVSFGQGIKYEDPYLIFAGTDASGNVYLARKNWGYIGGPQKTEYQSGRGWSQDPSQALPLKTSTGASLTSAGPVSFGSYRSKTWISVLENNSGEMTAKIYGSSGLWDSWAIENSASYNLGTSGSTYLGGTVCFQPVLRPNTARVSETCISAIPIVYAVRNVSNTSINIKWDLWPVPISGSRRIISTGASLGVSVGVTA